MRMAHRESQGEAPKASNRRLFRDLNDLVLEGIEIENFRAYEGRQYFPLAPVTLVFGANSAGKTTLFNAIGMLRQSLSQYGARNSGRLAIRGADVDFGIASEVPNRNNPKGEMAIRIFATPGAVQGLGGKSLYPTAAMEFLIENQQPRFGIGVKFGLVRPEEGSAYLQVTGYELFLGSDPKPLITFSRNDVVANQFWNRTEFQVESCNKSHPFWQWYVRQYGVKLLIHCASSDLSSDVDESNRDLTQLDDSVQNESNLGKFYNKLYLDLCAANSWTEKVDEEGHAYQSNALQEELFSIRNMHPQLKAAPENPIIRSVIRSNPMTDSVSPELISLLVSTVKPREIYSGNGWAPSIASPTAVSLSRMRMRKASLGQGSTVAGFGRLGGIERGLVSGADIPSLYPQDFLLSAAGSIAQIIENMETISARRGEFRRTFILGESEQPGELDVASASKAHVDRMNLALKNAKVPFTYDVRVFTPDTHGIATELKIGAVEVYDAVGRSKNIADVGTGTQYLLPVALAISNDYRGLLAIQEPESHLHPVLQAAVASLIAASADRKRQPIIIETHSEAILRRMIDHISGAAQPRVGVTAISVLHVSREGEVSSVRSIRVSDDGRLLDGWPEKARQEGFDV